MKISASISCADLLNLEHSIQELNASDIDFIHYDVVDGKFNTCFVLGDLLLETIRPLTSLPIEVHLAVIDPIPYLEPFIKAGATHIAVHIEVLQNMYILHRIRELGAIPVLAYRAETPPSIDHLPFYKEVGSILKLTVNPGFSGQKIQKQSFEHIRQIRELLDRASLQLDIQADGNVNQHTIKDLADAGATVFTGGTSGLFISNQSLNQSIMQLKEAAQCLSTQQM